MHARGLASHSEVKQSQGACLHRDTCSSRRPTWGAGPTRQTCSRTLRALPSLILGRCAMPMYGFAVGPAWPTERSAYDYLLSLTHPSWAWELLRRSDDYCLAAKVHGCIETRSLPGSDIVQISRTKRHWRHAEMWGLSCFRRSRSSGADGPCFVARRIRSPHSPL